ncbi:MAG: AbrB/MazE/SpoVT family DNA-binding domain-containing protein [Rhodospirillaceae bacterium]|nr:AbrB/MazE/SpoVT family DNA-binding domain-containing protein [Rhodospirillaceae bacterium]
MTYGTLTAKGQTTIPKEIRDQLNLKPGDRLNFMVDSLGRILIRPKNKSVTALKGLLYRPGQRAVTLEEMDAAIAEGAAKRAGIGHKHPRSLRRTG